MMQRWCAKLRVLAHSLHSLPKPPHHQLHGHSIISNRLFHTSPNLTQKPHIFSHSPNFINAPLVPRLCSTPISLTQVRTITAKQRTRKLKCRRPMPPVISKVKKIKIKGYSSFKGRFRLMKDGQIRRWKAGKRHNAHSKSRKSKSRLRQPAVVHPAYAKVMKKLNFGA